MSFVPPSISANCSYSDIAKTILAEGKNGVIQLTDLPVPPFLNIQDLFDHIHKKPEFIKRFNDAYRNNLVFKDSYSAGNGGPTVDMKRVLDLSPERLDEILRVDSSILEELAVSSDTKQVFDFWMDMTDLAPKLTEALRIASGCDDLPKDSHYNYRAVDYYERSADEVPPRCGEHRDFGSYTLIFTNRGGLEVFIDETWQRVSALGATGTAIMLFGWCTQIRSNGRISAALHRVVDDEITPTGVVPRRVSAVFFVAPKEASTPLEPTVLEGEKQKYVYGIKVGHLRGAMARKWKKREGTLSHEQQVLEEADILLHGATQDDYVKRAIEIAA